MKIVRLTPTHAAEYRAVMLQAYANESEAFTATVPERESLPLEWWASRVSDRPNPTELVYGAFMDARLVGVAGLRFKRRKRTRHKALLFGMAVLPPFRGRGIARALIEAIIDEAESAPDVHVLQLEVAESNTPALRLYESCGFQPFGTEPYALKIGKLFVSIVHMWRAVDQRASRPTR